MTAINLSYTQASTLVFEPIGCDLKLSSRLHTYQMITLASDRIPRGRLLAQQSAEEGVEVRWKCVVAMGVAIM
jgi:hypothetical protein